MYIVLYGIDFVPSCLNLSVTIVVAIGSSFVFLLYQMSTVAFIISDGINLHMCVHWLLILFGE